MPNDIIRTLAVKSSATASGATSYDLGSEAGKVLYTPNFESGTTITPGTQTDVNAALNYLGGHMSDILGDFAQVETSPTTSAHSVGNFIVYNNKLYKVTSAISAGGNLVVGTNITQTTVGSQVTSLNSNLPNFSYQTNNIIEGKNLNILMQAKSLTVNSDVPTEFTWPKTFGIIYFCWAQCVHLGFASGSTISVNGTRTGGKVYQKSGAQMVIQVFGIGSK